MNEEYQLSNRRSLGAALRSGRKRYRYDVILDGDVIGSIQSDEHESSVTKNRIRYVLGHPFEWRADDSFAWYHSRHDAALAVVRHFHRSVE